ncbi:MAG TPA: EAL domain-containing protein [Fimbriimonas sp.]|nr:EAL domain-containing protein [Fimbriimonas sp.]
MSRSYMNADEERERLERSLSVSSREMRARLVEINHQAFHDKLTGLPNRALFHDRLRNALAKRRTEQNQLALMFIDVDRFKLVNDSLGHQCGDELLKEIGARLERSVRAGDTVARLSGDEFTIILDGVASAAEAITLGKRILEAVIEPIQLQGTELYGTLSIGMALASANTSDDSELIRQADSAMYRSKSGGGNAVTLFDETMGIDALNRLELETSLRKALEHNEIFLNYQPYFDLESKRILGMEALARWKHPTLGMVQPSEFIPVAEDTGTIVSIGYWVLEQACSQVKAWKDDFAFGNAKLNVNMSGKQLEKSDVVSRVRDILDRTGYSGTDLNLEITESILLSNKTEITQKLKAIRDLGITVSVDDFGTGYSSLSVLRTMPVDTLKIDRSFITNVETENDSKAIIEAVMALARNLRMNVIAEGIETEAQRDALVHMGCVAGQGYLFAKPLGLPEMEKLLSRLESRTKRKAA